MRLSIRVINYAGFLAHQMWFLRPHPRLRQRISQIKGQIRIQEGLNPPHPMPIPTGSFRVGTCGGVSRWVAPHHLLRHSNYILLIECYMHISY